MMRKILKNTRIFPAAFAGRFLCFFTFFIPLLVFAIDDETIPLNDSIKYHYASGKIYIAEGATLVNAEHIFTVNKQVTLVKKEKSAPVRSKILAKKEVKKQSNPTPEKVEEPKAHFRAIPYTPNSFFTISGGKITIMLPLTQNYTVALAILNKNTYPYINLGEDAGKTPQSSLFHILETTLGAFCTRPPPVLI